MPPVPAAARASCLYLGRVMHARLRPFRHRFNYRVASMLVDLDELPALGRLWPLFGVERGGIFSFRAADHGPRDGRPLRPWITAELAKVGLDCGRVRLLCFPRILGYVFNPLTIWFCEDAGGRIVAMLYEVKNTFGQQHCYLLPVAPGRNPGAAIEQACAKGFYVSPFIAMQADYRFRVAEPGDRLSVVIRQSDADGEFLVATQTGRRVPFAAAGLLRVLFGYPMMTLKVMAAIHWEALRIWRKGGRLHDRPAAPAMPVTHVRTDIGRMQ